MVNKNRRRHKVLKILVDTRHNEWDNGPNNGAVYFFKINEELKLNKDKVYADCLALVENGDAIKGHDEDYLDMFTVTDRGKYSYYDKVYINKIWWRSQKFWSIFIPILISLGALAVSIFALYGNSCPPCPK